MTKHVATTEPMVINGVDELLAAVGTVLGTSAWKLIDQKMVDGFAEVTGDDYWGHVDPLRSAASDHGGTIAHGLLTLSLHPGFIYSLVEFQGFKQLFNYGYDRVRFPAAVPTGARVRTTATLTSATKMRGGVRATIVFEFECDAVDKPVCVAEYVQFFATND